MKHSPDPRWRPSAMIRESVLFAVSGRLLTASLIAATCTATAVAATLLITEWNDTITLDASLHRDGRDVWIFQSAEGINAARCEAVNAWHGVEAAGGTASGEVIDDILVVPFTGELGDVFGVTDQDGATASVLLGPAAAATAGYPRGLALIGDQFYPASTIATTPRSEGHANSMFVRAAGLLTIDTCHIALANGSEATLVPALTGHLSSGGAIVDARQGLSAPTRAELIDELHDRPVRFLAPAFGLMIGAVAVGTSLARRTELALYRDIGLSRAQTTSVANGATTAAMLVGLLPGTAWALALTSASTAGATTTQFVTAPMLALVGAALGLGLVGNGLLVVGLTIVDRR